LVFVGFVSPNEPNLSLLPFFAGVLRVDFGSYLQAFILSGILCLVAALLVLFVGGETKTSAQPSAA
jgi:hypothetical protein